jgi:uncharacterized protein (TIGR03067 family)
MRTRTLHSAALSAATTLAVTIVGAIAFADEPALTGDLAKLQGEWTALFGAKKNVPMVVTIKGTGVTLAITAPDGQVHESKGEIKIDENARPYKTLDWIKFPSRSGGTAPENLGIYTLNGDAITICNGGPGNPRPTEFKAGEGGPPQLFVLNRKASAPVPAAAPAPAPTAAADRDRLQGRWTGKVGKEKNITLVLTINGDSATIGFKGPKGQGRESKGEIKIDENARPHKTLDWVKFTKQSGEAVADNLAIYTLEGDTLSICSGGVGNARPTEFKAGEGGKPSLIVLTRE